MPDACRSPAGAPTRRRACCHRHREVLPACVAALRPGGRRCLASTNPPAPSPADLSSQPRHRQRGRPVPPAVWLLRKE
eukprot:6206847-Pleurochrysis_carterae.AAC.2